MSDLREKRIELILQQLEELPTLPVVADAADPVSAARLLDQFRPTVLVLNAGASPLSRPLQGHTWESFSANWAVDVQQALCSHPDVGYAVAVNYSRSKAEAEETADGVRSRGAGVLVHKADVGDDAAGPRCARGQGGLDDLRHSREPGRQNAAAEDHGHGLGGQTHPDDQR